MTEPLRPRDLPAGVVWVNRGFYELGIVAVDIKFLLKVCFEEGDEGRPFVEFR